MLPKMMSLLDPCGFDVEVRSQGGKSGYSLVLGCGVLNGSAAAKICSGGWHI